MCITEKEGHQHPRKEIKKISLNSFDYIEQE